MKDRASPLFILVAMITAITALYVAKSILLPLALAILLSFLFTPLVDRLERWRMPRVPAVLGVVAISFAILGSVAWVVTNQLVQLGLELPQHEAELIQKIKSLKPDSPTLTKLTKTLTDLSDEISLGPAPTAKDGEKSTDSQQLADGAIDPKAADSDSAQIHHENETENEKAVAVKVVEMPPSRLQQIQDWLGPVVGPLATSGLVIVLVLFMLLDRENQRSRLIQLFGRSHMHATTEAVHDVSRRVGRYLRALFIVNAGYGLVIAIGLWMIGVPGASLWGVLGFSLRFLPYIGPWIAATLPIMFSIATSAGWVQPLVVLGWYILVELISNNIVEPLAYGSTTGVSTVGVIIAAIFWTWLWGPIGLILSMPMTVCLLVAARYVPQLKFLTILLADRPPMSLAERTYQRLLAFDYHEPLKLALGQIKESSPVEYYDSVLIPALALAEQDRHSDLLSEQQAAFVFETTEDIVDEVGEEWQQREAKRLTDGADSTIPDNSDSVAGPSAPPTRIMCIPLRDEADEIAGRMLAQLLTVAGFQVDAGTAQSLTSERVDRVAESESDIVVISVLPPITPRDSRLLWRRLRGRYPHLPIVVGFWTAKAQKQYFAEPFEDSTSKVVTTFAEAISAIQSMAADVKLTAKTA